jgi:hypothetical protein
MKYEDDRDPFHVAMWAGERQFARTEPVVSGEKVSSCCSVPDRPMGEDGPSFEDVGLCPNCREHCEFEAEDDQ